MNEPVFEPGQRTWHRKFADAFRGIRLGMREQSSFRVHHASAFAVLLAAWFFQLAAWQWTALLICITLVMTAEMFNSALERLAQAVDPGFNPHVGAALEIASAAVLLSAIGASTVAAVVFLPELLSLMAVG
jgi:diacylglycerol kinase